MSSSIVLSGRRPDMHVTRMLRDASKAVDIQLLDPGTLALTTLSAGLTGSWIMGYASRLVIGDSTGDLAQSLEAGGEDVIRAEPAEG